MCDAIILHKSNWLIDWLIFAGAGPKGDLKRHGDLLESYPLKKRQHVHVVSSLVGEHGQGFMGAHDADARDS
jgi:hypothetical protein